MIIRVAAASAVPIYRQIVDQFTWQVAAGRLRVGDRLPSVRDLARAIPVNQNTVLKAYEILERDGLIDRRQGDGTFVAGRGSPLSAVQRRRIVRELLSDAAARGLLLDIPPAELHKLLDEELARVQGNSNPPSPAEGGTK